jgi:hypothetical protein
MATDENLTDDQQNDPEYRKPNPQENPRNIALKEIASSVAEQHKVEFAETAPSIDDDGNVTPAPEAAPAEEAPAEEAPAEEPAAEPVAEVAATPEPVQDAIDPNKKYKVKVDGMEMEVPGKAIIDAGYRTFQKETAADYRLKMASELLKEAQAKAQGAIQPDVPKPAPTQAPSEKSDAELANEIQFGTPEQAATAISQLRTRGVVTQEQVQQFAAQQARIAAKDELQFQDALNFVQSEYKDLLSNAHLKDLFFLNENKARAAGDKRPYKELYKAIGDDLRSAFKMTKPQAGANAAPTPTGTVAARQALKRDTAPVPRTAASRMSEAADSVKVKTHAEIIAGMAASRGKTQLNPLRKG